MSAATHEVQVVYPEFGTKVPNDRWDPAHFLYVLIEKEELMKDGEKITTVSRGRLWNLAESALQDIKPRLAEIPAALGALANEGATVQVIGPDDGDYYIEIPKARLVDHDQ